MATLTKSTGTVTLSGAVEKVVLPAAFGWVWFWNMSDSDMYAGLSENISEGADGVAAIPAGGCRRIQTDGFKSVYLLGTGNVEISAQNYADCPFKAGGKGGEMPDLSVYALKSKYGDTTINVGRNEATDVGGYSSALGYQTVASGDYSHAEGHTAAATGSCSHAEGYYTQAAGYDSHAGGYASTATGAISFAHGSHISVNNENEVGFGAYNKSSDNTLFSIGNGTSWSEQHNAFEITKTGGKLHDKDIAVDVSNPNLLINPDFKINQRGVSGTKIPDKNADGDDIHTYFVDRWGVDSGRVTVNADGTLTLNGTISQIFENAVGNNVTASVSAGTAVYDDSTKTFSITANGEIISWAKLEYGSNATQFFPPDTASEFLKCMRYYEVISAGADRTFSAYIAPDLHAEADISFKVLKRIAPSLIINGLRTVISTSTGYIISHAVFQLYQSEIYGITFNTVDQIVTELPSYLLGVTLDGSFAVDAEIY